MVRAEGAVHRERQLGEMDTLSGSSAVHTTPAENIRTVGRQVPFEYRTEKH